MIGDEVLIAFSSAQPIFIHTCNPDNHLLRPFLDLVLNLGVLNLSINFSSSLGIHFFTIWASKDEPHIFFFTPKFGHLILEDGYPLLLHNKIKLQSPNYLLLDFNFLVTISNLLDQILVDNENNINYRLESH